MEEFSVGVQVVDPDALRPEAPGGFFGQVGFEVHVLRQQPANAQFGQGLGLRFNNGHAGSNGRCRFRLYKGCDVQILHFHLLNLNDFGLLQHIPTKGFPVNFTLAVM